ncbi:glycosyltransferase [Leptolyngbya sp. GB1-A1]|uniref:glycosyltransferase n=1 Tax=Leptolyngbya sp. GB1-A1 TaxID=2933908 RepID=UPI003296D30A
MIYIVVEGLVTPTGFKNNSARNLLVGLRELGIEFTIIDCQSEIEPAHRSTSFAQIQTCELGPYLSVNLPIVKSWRDPNCVQFFRNLIDSLPDSQGIFHIVEAYGYLGCWLAALKSTAFKVVFTALDYHWLCNLSWLITRQGKQCSGPQTVDACLACSYDHREPLKAAVLKGMLFASTLPDSLLWFVPAKISQDIQQIEIRRQIVDTRLATFRQEFNQVDAVIAPSLALGEILINNGLAREKIVHIPYGTQSGQRLSVKDRPPLHEAVVFGFIGRMSFDKGIDILIDTLAKLRRKTASKFRLVVFSSLKAKTGFEHQIMKKIQTNAWISIGQFDGRNPQSIDAAHRQIHFQVAPSRWTDNLPNAVLEGIERNTPVIAPNYGSFPEMIIHGTNGWLYNSSDQFEALLAEIVHNPEKFLALNYEHPSQRYPIAEAQDVSTLYNQLLDRAPAKF